ncbi:uncharacterized protein PAC_07308 [Phialocephala subalpina]|uniref:Uncharacterized protein n=1 Tax=Phialocephala subalpina TaxID=576137 RepID=A0A1L7WXC6_9HELO|nr:uncharacterized protein PAC_07308 [Phialocephala subalpina]
MAGKDIDGKKMMTTKDAERIARANPGSDHAARARKAAARNEASKRDKTKSSGSRSGGRCSGGSCSEKARCEAHAAR